MATVTITFSLDTETDQAILRWIDSLPRRKRSEAIREALRGHLEHDVSLGDVYQAIQKLEYKISHAMVLVDSGNNKEVSSEPEDIADALDNLGL